jgi:hypothetical protein
VSDEQDHWSLSADFSPWFHAAEHSPESEIPQPELQGRKSYFQHGVIVWEPGNGAMVMKRKAARSQYEPWHEVVDPKPTRGWSLW